MLIKNTFQKRLSFELFGKPISLESGETIKVDKNIGKLLLKSSWIEEVKPEIEKTEFRIKPKIEPKIEPKTERIRITENKIIKNKGRTIRKIKRLD